jgi:hypothetical protein
MRRISVRKMMLIVAGLAIACAIVASVKRVDDPESDLGSVRYQCRNHMRELALALVVYHRTNKHFPAGTWPNPSLPPEARLSWYASLLPEIEQEDLYREIDKTAAWNVDPNDAFTSRRPGLLRCPALFRVSPPPKITTNYIGVAGIGKDAPILPEGDPRCGVFGYDRRTTLADITDGAANTLMIVESGRATGSWLQGGFATVRGLDPTNLPYLGPNRQFGGLHQGGAWVATADGSVRWARDSIDPRVFGAISTIAGGEKVAPFK